MHDPARTRQGIALLAALAVMTLIALLIVGALAVSTIAQRSSRLSHGDALLTGAADYAINSVLSGATQYALADLPFGAPRTFVVPSPDDASIASAVTVTRLRLGLLWLVADVSLSGVDQGHRRINVVAGFPMAGSAPGAGIVARGPVSLSQHVTFSSGDATEPGCGQDTGIDVLAAPGMDVTSAAGVRTSHSAAASDSSTFFLAARQVSALAAAANVIHVRGDTTIAGGSFDGILIVDGALTIGGPFAANGLIIAAGRMSARAGGFAVTGAVMSFAVPADGAPAIELVDASVRYSQCTIEHALRAANPPRPVQQRSWAELF